MPVHGRQVARDARGEGAVPDSAEVEIPEFLILSRGQERIVEPKDSVLPTLTSR